MLSLEGVLIGLTAAIGIHTPTFAISIVSSVFYLLISYAVIMDLYQEFKKQQDLSLTTGDVQVKNEGTGSQLFVDQSGSATIAPEVLDCVMEWKCLPIHSIYDQRIWTRSAWIFRIEGILSRTNQI